MIDDNEDANFGVNLEKRGSMKARYDHVKGHDLGREMRILKGPQKKKP